MVTTIKNKPIRVLGVDPGSQFTGIGLVDGCQKNLTSIHHEVVKLPVQENHAQRLKILFDRLCNIVQIFQPDVFAIENVFLSKNASSALKLGQVRGVILLAASHHNLPVAEYSSTQVKRLISGFGLSGKDEMASWVSRLLGPLEVERHDATDALSIALAYHFLNQGNQLNSQMLRSKNKRSLTQLLTRT